MTAAPVTVRLDPRRLEQLKAIATATSSTSAGVIAQFIRDKIEQGVIPQDIPGIVVHKVGDIVQIDLSKGYGKAYSFAAALQLAGTIRSVVEGGEASTVNLDFGFAVLKQGTGFKIAAPFPGPEVSFPGDLAIDLADLIEEAAK